MRQRILALRATARLPRQARFLPLFLGIVVWLTLSGQATGQENPPTPPPGVVIPPSGSAPPNGQAGAPTTGVIHPPAHVDPGMKVKPPVPPAQLPTPVIPPPGTPGGDQSVQPR